MEVQYTHTPRKCKGRTVRMMIWLLSRLRRTVTKSTVAQICCRAEPLVNLDRPRRRSRLRLTTHQCTLQCAPDFPSACGSWRVTPAKYGTR